MPMTPPIPPTPPATPATGPSVWARFHLATWRGRFAWFFALVLLAFFTCWVLVRMTPSWYRPLDPDDPGVVQTAGRAQTLVTFELHNAAERVMMGPQRWTITQDELNSFLAVNTTPPFDETGKRGTLDPVKYPLTDPYIVFKKGSVMLCARFTKVPGQSPQGGVVSVTFSVGTVTGPDGSLMGLVKLTDVHAGRMPLPRSIVQERLSANVGGINAIVRQVAQIDLGKRDMKDADPLLEQMVRCAIEGQPFPMRYRSNGKDFTVQELNVDDGVFSVVLASMPATTRPPPATLPATRPSATLPR